MQPQEYNLILRRLNRFERRARWHWVERFITLGLVAQLLLGPAGTLRREAARVQALQAGERARMALTRGISTARQALFVRPVLDPRTVLEDEREVSMDAKPILPAPAMLAQSSVVTAPPAARSRLRKKSELLAERRPVSRRISASQTAATSAVKVVRPLAPENALTFSSSVSEAERQMARASDNSAEHVAALMDSPLASSAATRDGTTPGAGMAFGLSAPETLWKAVAGADSHRKPAVGRDPFNFAGSFAGPFAAQSEPPSQTAPTTVSRNSDPQPVAAVTPEVTVPALPAVTLKALGYAQSADGTAQAVLTDGITLYVVNEGEEFAGRFRVIAIRPEDLEVEDEYTNQTFRLPLAN
jgi:hypothetical protein